MVIRENPGGSGTFSEVTPQTTEQREHYATEFISVRTGQQLQLGGDRGKAWPKHISVSVIDEKRVSYQDADTMRALPAGDGS